jgi:hypothetical protein
MTSALAAWCAYSGDHSVVVVLRPLTFLSTVPLIKTSSILNGIEFEGRHEAKMERTGIPRI